MTITETDHCPLDGSRVDPRAVAYTRDRHTRRPDPLVLVAGRILPAFTTDAQAEHERAMCGAYEWSRLLNGLIVLWVER